ncbi:uncharacterized protein [Lolium perenne]|uniref:uncharacterized protein isoform X2 n=1 Tax=Lolium perenne TaxID=4522 RepID=UPI0021F543EC|nr:uncharacterized protein LOC127345435 isoform X1 [Lolium perenne]
MASEIALKAVLDGNPSLLKKMASKVDLLGAKDAKGNTVLHCAAFGGCLESCRFLVEECGIDVNAVSKTGGTPMSYAAKEGNVQVMRYLLDRGGNPAMPDKRGSTPLHGAALGGHCEAVRLLLSKGVPVDPVDHRGAPLHLAASKDHVEVVKVLLEHAADINKVVNHIVSPLNIALCGKSLKCIKLLIEAGADVNPLGSSAPTPLAQAVHDGLTDIIKLLLEAGADVNGLGSSTPTPLAQAVYDGLTDIIKLLLEAGADPNIPDQQGLIPIEQAAVRRRRELVEVLFPWTKPISCLPDWSVNGIIRTVNYWRINPLQAAVSMEERTAYWKSQGKEAFARGDYLTAISCYDKVLDINPSDTPMHANKSLCWLRMRHGGLALEDARKCKMIRPRWSKAWYREGAALSFMKDYDGAADAFGEALQLDPKSEEIREAPRKAEKAAEESWRM